MTVVNRSARQLGRRTRINRPALHEQAAKRLRTMIVRGLLKAGERIGETDLAKALGVSRTPLREALKLLAAQGLVELRPNRGARIAVMRQEDVAELFEVVSGIERLAAELTAERMSGSELRQLRLLQEHMEKHYRADELDKYFQTNQQVHKFVIACARNNVLKDTHDWILARVERARYLALYSRERWEQSVLEHRQILAALEARDGDLAGRLLSDHVRHTGEAVNRALEMTRADAA